MLGWWLGSWLGWSAALAADSAVWSGVFLQSALHEPGQSGPRLWLDLHARRDGGRFLGVIRPALGYDLSRQTSVYAGYAWIPSASPGSALAHEHRLWQQLLWATSRDKLGASLRPRLEQRFSSGAQGVGLRVRLMGRGQLDLPAPLALVVWDEVFLGLNDAFLPAGFDQNRLFLGPALKGDGFRVEVGYLDQRLWRERALTSVSAVAANVFATF